MSGPAAYILMMIAPLLAAAAAFRRGRLHAPAIRSSWYAIAWSLAIWAAAAFVNLWQEMILHRPDEVNRWAMLAFNLAVVPTTFMLATDWQLRGRQLLRVVDALVALALGYAYFLYTWHAMTGQAGKLDAGVIDLAWLLDLQNLYLSAAGCARWYAAEDRDERDLFRTYAAYKLLYFVIVLINDHIFAPNPAYGPEYGTIITLAFAVLAGFALRSPSTSPVRPVSPLVVNVVRGGSPILLALALLAASLFLVRVDYLWGCIGILIAVLGLGVRVTLSQVLQMERDNALRRETSALKTMAWTDALTGIPNRLFFTEALGRLWRGERSRERPAILMIDIDHFKLLNDRYGHPAGDGCLQSVAQALRHALVRPDDVLARYGGEEFIVLLRDNPESGVRVVAEKLRAAVGSLAIENLDSPYHIVTVSIGAASAELTDENTAVRLVESADRALYEAKCAGRNRVRLATDRAYDPDATDTGITARRRRLLLPGTKP
ncbi:MAG TPA: GGDEF domain-containing protein [Steroidobacteraceae bacterium]|nr:GGDEF domain-containing protein [Steroidobacteraceae bacterium]